MDRRVPYWILTEISRYPNSEEGGKYIGFLNQERTATEILITDFLPSGPNAKRSTVEFWPDGEYQETLFRSAERVDPRVEHIGSWHSHHCNGLRTLSDRDVTGYFRTVNRPQYRPEFFVVSLATQVPRVPDETDWLQHFLFVRGDREFYKLNGEVALIDAPTVFGHITGHHSTQSLSGEEAQPGPAQSSSCVAASSNAAQSDDERWFDSVLGKQVLAEDRRFFADTFGGRYRATRVHGRIKITGVYENGGSLSIVYPTAVADDSVQIETVSRARGRIVISCPLALRTIAFAGALRMHEMM